MKKNIFTWILTVFASFIICFVLYTVNKDKIYGDISEESVLKEIEAEIQLYKDSKNDDADKILEQLYSTKGSIYRHDEKYGDAYNCYNTALKLAQKNKHNKHMAELTWFMIGLAAEQKQNALVLSLCEKYHKHIEQYNGDSIFLPLYMVYYWRGMAYLSANQTEAACKNLNRGLKLFNSKTNSNRNDKVLLSCALSIVYARKQDFSKAEEFLNNAVELLTKYSLFSIKWHEDIYRSFKHALIEIEKTKPPHSVILGEAYRTFAKFYNIYDSPEDYLENMLKAVKMYPNASPQVAEVYFELGKCFYQNPKYYFDKCVTALAGVRSNSAATMLMEISLQYMTYAPDKVPHILQLTLKALPDSQPDLLIAAQANQFLAKHFSESREWTKSVDFSRKSLAVIKRDRNIKERAAIVANCFLYLDRAYEAEKAVQKRLKSAEAARKFMESESEYCYLPEVYKRLGQIYTVLKQYPQAEKSYREILKLVKEHPEICITDNCSILQIDALCAIGELQVRQKNEKETLAVLAGVEKILNEKGTKLPEWYIATIWINIGNGYYSFDRDSLSELYYQKAVSFFLLQKAKYSRRISYLYYKIGSIYFNNQKWQKAQGYFEKAWENISEKETDIDSIILLANDLSVCYHQNNEIKKALEFSLLAYRKQGKKYGSNLQTGVYAFTVGAAYDKLNDKNNAVKYLKLAHEIFLKYRKDDPNPAKKTEKYLKNLQQKQSQ